MNTPKIAAIALIVAGLLGLMYGGFSFTRATHTAQLGPMTMSVQEKETVNIPMWAGVAAIVAGVGLLAFGGRRS